MRPKADIAFALGQQVRPSLDADEWIVAAALAERLSAPSWRTARRFANVLLVPLSLLGAAPLWVSTGGPRYVAVTNRRLLVMRFGARLLGRERRLSEVDFGEWLDELSVVSCKGGRRRRLAVRTADGRAVWLRFPAGWREEADAVAAALGPRPPE